MADYHLGILGYPLTHSLSPLLHELFLKETGLQGGYEKFECKPSQISDWVYTHRPFELAGFNVTIPYKTQFVPFLKRLSEQADFIGAVNTVQVKEQELWGENTDVHGFSASFDPETLTSLKGAHVLILGAGGACRAVGYALLMQPVASLTLWSRSAERATASLVNLYKMNQFYRNNEVSLYFQTEMEALPLEEMTAVINTTPVGMFSEIDQTVFPLKYLKRLPASAWVYDLIYNPLETRLLQDARSLGLKTQHGLDMLIHQGAKSFKLWTGQSISDETFQKARNLLSEALEKS
jgi:shikimate dehydrogenase